MSDTTKPLPPLAEALRLNAEVSGAGVRKRGPRDANLYWDGCRDAFEHAVQVAGPYDAEMARLRELLREALPFLIDKAGDPGAHADLMRRIREAVQ